MAASEYPKRESHFAHRYVRLLYKICAAQHIGVDAVSLLTCIAHQEDAKRYRGPVTYFNGQLAPMLGFAKWERLDKARAIAVKSGFLHYENHGKRSPGIYWVTIPDEHLEVSDTPTDEGEPTFHDGLVIGRKEGWVDGYNACAKRNGLEPLYPSLYPDEGYKQGVNDGINRESRRGQTGSERGDKQGEPSILYLEESSIEDSSIPAPTPCASHENSRKPRTRKAGVFQKPDVEEIAAYCCERQNAIDPEYFFDAYERTGWKLSNGLAMKDWKAAIRYWERNPKNQKPASRLPTPEEDANWNPIDGGLGYGQR